MDLISLCRKGLHQSWLAENPFESPQAGSPLGLVLAESAQMWATVERLLAIAERSQVVLRNVPPIALPVLDSGSA